MRRVILAASALFKIPVGPIGVGLVFGLASAVFPLTALREAAAQNVQRQSYVMSETMHHDLDDRQFDSARVEEIVNGISNAMTSESLGGIIDAASPEIRITDKGSNKVVKKADLAKYKDALLHNGALRATLADESQFILRADSVGLGGGTFWISEECLDEKCAQKKTRIVTINLP